MTVSGGGKSEISKPITDSIIQGPVFVADFKEDFDRVEELVNRSYEGRFRDGRKTPSSRAILSSERSLGSVIKLLTPAPDLYSDEYSKWLEAVPQYQRELVFVVKRFYSPEWGPKWREHFSVDFINGVPGHELKCDNRRLVTNYLRVGFDADGAWRTFGLRKDYYPASKLAVEDDITASITVPSSSLENLNPGYHNPAFKFVKNCEQRLFQRPDDAIHPGYDKQTEADFAKPGNFFSNYQPLMAADARELMEDTIGFDQFSSPMQKLIRESAEAPNGSYFVSSANPRIVDGKPSKNPRYLQLRPDLVHPRDAHLAEIGARSVRRISPDMPLHRPVNAVLPGRRNNPPEGDVRPLAVFNPVHYLELPELFMEFICSVTGKSPSTTGAGSDPSEFEDTYEVAVVDMLKQKQAGKTVSKAAPKVAAAQTGNVIDLLKRSLELSQKHEEDESAIHRARNAEGQSQVEGTRMKDQITALMEALNRSQYEIGRLRRGQQGLETTISAVEKILADPVVAAAIQNPEPFTGAPSLVPEQNTRREKLDA